MRDMSSYLFNGENLKVVYIKNMHDKDGPKEIDDLISKGFTIKGTLASPLGNNIVLLEKRT